MIISVFPHRAGVVVALALGVAACDDVGLSALPSCDTERAVAGWTVSAGLEQSEPGGALINKWEARRNFSTHFGIRIAYDTSKRPEPYLKIWHNYKAGDFTMRLQDGAHLTTRLRANYAVTSTALRPVDFDYLKSQPVRIEHTSHTNKWSVYETDGLPEAIAAGEADLAEAKQRLADRGCAA